MEKWSTRTINKTRLSPNTVEFTFTKPAGLQYKAGQHVLLKLPFLNDKDERGPIRPFTLCSSPDQDSLVITTRMSESGYKKTLYELDSTTELLMLGPRGEFIFYESSSPRILIAGGIGITPFLSMLKNTNWDQSGSVDLYYSNKSKTDAVYHTFFSSLQQTQSKFSYFPIYTRQEDEQNKRIDKPFLQDLLGPITPSFYVCGPPQMVVDVTSILEELDAELAVYSESFFGY
jgi:ferredoxin-NADP reductase